jgi:hypothetical protein
LLLAELAIDDPAERIEPEYGQAQAGSPEEASELGAVRTLGEMVDVPALSAAVGIEKPGETADGADVRTMLGPISTTRPIPTFNPPPA